jgi:hypothetical protein
MLTKNISVEIEKGKKVPLKETYLVFYKSKNDIKLVQKFIDKTKNVSISLDFNECKRLINLLNFYLLDGDFEPYMDKMLTYEKN